MTKYYSLLSIREKLDNRLDNNTNIADYRIKCMIDLNGKIEKNYMVTLEIIPKCSNISVDVDEKFIKDIDKESIIDNVVLITSKNPVTFEVIEYGRNFKNKLVGKLGLEYKILYKRKRSNIVYDSVSLKSLFEISIGGFETDENKINRILPIVFSYDSKEKEVNAAQSLYSRLISEGFSYSNSTLDSPLGEFLVFSCENNWTTDMFTNYF